MNNSNTATTAAPDQPYKPFIQPLQPLQVGLFKTDLNGNIQSLDGSIKIDFSRVTNEPDLLAVHYHYEGFTPCYFQALRNLNVPDFSIKIFRPANTGTVKKYIW